LNCSANDLEPARCAVADVDGNALIGFNFGDVETVLRRQHRSLLSVADQARSFRTGGNVPPAYPQIAPELSRQVWRCAVRGIQHVEKYARHHPIG
jgi:hypothetical protein